MFDPKHLQQGFPMSVDIGGRLRFVRARHKLSQRELAKRSGVTNSTISLIESNQMNPSVGALKRILDGLPMGLAEFFALPVQERLRIENVCSISPTYSNCTREVASSPLFTF